MPALTTNQNAGFVTVPSENKIILIKYIITYLQKTLQKYCSGKQAKEGWVLVASYDTKHGVGTPYLKPADVSSSSKGQKTIKRYSVYSVINTPYSMV